jgi:hypothetical protein
VTGGEGRARRASPGGAGCAAEWEMDR